MAILKSRCQQDYVMYIFERFLSNERFLVTTCIFWAIERKYFVAEICVPLGCSGKYNGPPSRAPSCLNSRLLGYVTIYGFTVLGFPLKHP